MGQAEPSGKEGGTYCDGKRRRVCNLIKKGGGSGLEGVLE